MNSSAEVIGIAAATFQNGQNLNFAIPATYLRALIADITSPVPLARRVATPHVQSIFSGIGSQRMDGVVAEAFSWNAGFGIMDGGYTFTLRNRLHQAVRDVECLVIFTGQTGKPVDFAHVRSGEVIPAGLATRIINSDHVIEGAESLGMKSFPVPLKVDDSVRRLSRSVQFRILDFKMAP